MKGNLCVIFLNHNLTPHFMTCYKSWMVPLGKDVCLKVLENSNSVIIALTNFLLPKEGK